MSEGRVLYTEIAYKEGPLSMGALALLFRAFGASLASVVWVNLALLAGLTALIHGIFARACGAFAAALVCLLFLCVFAFSQYVGIANYNYVCPYTPEQTHGLLLAVAMICAFERSLRKAPAAWCAAAGLCLGLVSLTKLELFAPAALAAALGLALVLPSAGRSAPAAFAAGALVPPLGAWLLLLAWMPADSAFAALTGNLRYLGDAAGAAFYRRAMGFDDAPRNLGRSLAALAGVVAAAGAAAVASAWLPVSSRAGKLACALLSLALGATLALWPGLIRWRAVARALPWTSAAACAGLVAACVRRRRDPAALRRLLGLALWSVLAVGLLPKMGLDARVSHYGFVLAMPAALLLAATLVWGVPARLRAAGRDGTLARALLAALVLAAAGGHLRLAQRIYAHKTLRVGSGRDAFLAGSPAFDARGWVMAAAAERLRARMEPGATLLALPEGTMLNYWLRAASPSRYTLFTPTQVAHFGEPTILADLEAHPPDWIALVARDSEEFGTGRFGEESGYGHALAAWVGRHYEPLERVGVEPDCDGCFEVELLRRRSASAR